MSAALDIAIVHHLPAIGGAARVIAEYVARRPNHRVTVYTRMPEPEQPLVVLPDHAAVIRLPLPQPRGRLGRVGALLTLPRRGRELAAIIDGAGHDVVFAHASELVQSHEVLPWLRTPSVAYAPEPLRGWYEQIPRVGPGRAGLRERLVAWHVDPYERLRARRDRSQLPHAGTVVTHSRFTARALAEIYAVQAEVVPLGVDAATFAGPAAPRERSVLSVGALHPLKGHQFVIEALATIPASGRPRLVVVGDRGELAGALRDLAATRGVELELVTAAPLDALVARYRRAGAVACGQIREPFGLVPLEAMAAGAPVVAVDEGGLAETVVHDRSGLLTRRDPGEFGAALLAVLDDAALARRLTATALREVAERWTWERVAQEYDRLLFAAARKPQGSPP